MKTKISFSSTNRDRVFLKGLSYVQLKRSKICLNNKVYKTSQPDHILSLKCSIERTTLIFVSVVQRARGAYIKERRKPALPYCCPLILGPDLTAIRKQSALIKQPKKSQQTCRHLVPADLNSIQLALFCDSSIAFISVAISQLDYFLTFKGLSKDGNIICYTIVNSKKSTRDVFAA